MWRWQLVYVNLKMHPISHAVWPVMVVGLLVKSSERLGCGCGAVGAMVVVVVKVATTGWPCAWFPPLSEPCGGRGHQTSYACVTLLDTKSWIETLLTVTRPVWRVPWRNITPARYPRVTGLLVGRLESQVNIDTKAGRVETSMVSEPSRVQVTLDHSCHHELNYHHLDTEPVVDYCTCS